jgi:YhcH/YjgK/YiaL family protein
MIVDTLSRCKHYVALHPSFGRAFDFIGSQDLLTLLPGRHEIDGQSLYLSIDHKEGRGRAGARLESHRRYVDIQVTLHGDEQIGWRAVSDCLAPAGPFDDAKDIRFYDDRPDSWFRVRRGYFAIFFPDDAHAPLGGNGLLKKAIFKVAI